jgi:tetratricopeptide (TPR) repeat protein
MEKKHLCYILLVTVIIFSSCSTTSVHLQVLTPAEITVPAHLRKVIVANRSLPERNEKSLNILEGFLTGESILADREGSKYCIDALVDELNDNPRYEAILKDNDELSGTGTRQFPEPLNMIKVKEICSQYRADGLILLETFDSNIDIINGTEQVKKKVDNKEITVTEYISDLHINVNAGWRIYDPVNSKIIDQNQFMDEKSWSGRGDSKKSALKALPSKRSAINESGAFAGMRYGKRISPNWKWVSRDYYIRKHASFKVARNYVKKDQWDKAAELWNAMTRDLDTKTAGRACYNMALANEMEGHLDVALEWAQKAYDQYHNKAAKSYSKQLKSRLDQQKSLNEQMEGVN